MAITANQLVNSANSHLGITKYSSGHKKIIDTYNSVKPLPMGYAVTYHDDWCDAFVTYIGIILKATELIGRECGVQRHKAIFEKMGIWVGKTKPKAGDIVIFDWQDNGWADHIGYVKSFDGTYITTVEGNTNNKVGSNKFKWDDWRIVGYARPKYGATGSQTLKPLAEVAAEVLVGLWGNGQDRINNLTVAGYDATKVQAEVNALLVSGPGNEVDLDEGVYLSYDGDNLTEDLINTIMTYCRQYDIDPIYVITVFHFETMWGRADSAKLNNNWAGMSTDEFKGTKTRPSGVVVTQGSARPAGEGGYYYKYASVSDFLKDWFYLMRPSGIYKVSGAGSFDAHVKGMFKVGGAKADYAASGYDHYMTGMVARRNQIDKFNPGKLDAIAKAYADGTKIDGQDVIAELPKPSTGKSIEAVAKEVIAGNWGVGESRVTALTEAGYDYETVQAKVNELMKPVGLKQLDEVAKDVIAGKYGNGKDRTERLRQAGYDAKAVQEKVNELLKPDLTEVAKDVIRGQYGNGQARIRNLRAVGYNPDEVQKVVNKLL